MKSIRAQEHRSTGAQELINTACALVTCALVLLCSGCVERRLTINTNPSGAVVLLNDEEIGTSPVTVPFNWYGDYNVTVRKPGCETLAAHRNLARPWYDYFPFDFLTGCLYPGRIVDSYQWSFDLTLQKEIDRNELIRAAEQIKESVP